jgi:ABC-type lipoprotein release transport system permease subunit
MNASIRGVAAPDAAVFAWAAALLLALVLAASVIPARRVLGIEPAGLLRVQ